MDAPLFLVLTDFSDASRAAYGTAASLAERLGGRLEIVHVAREVQPALYAPPTVAPVTPLTTEELLDSAEKSLSQERERIPERVPATTRVLRGADVPQIVVEHAHAEGAEMIVLATHGRSGLRRALLGSAAEEILRASDVPLLIVPAKTAEDG
jgi:nucleotide-binding universal stress UspA family protein